MRNNVEILTGAGRKSNDLLFLNMPCYTLATMSIYEISITFKEPLINSPKISPIEKRLKSGGNLRI